MSILTWFLAAAATAFPNPYEIGARRSGVEPKAAMVSVASSDLQRLVGVAQRIYFAEELRGSITAGQLGTEGDAMTFDRLDYRFRVRRLDVRPAGDSYRVELDLAGVNLAINTVFLDASRARTCTGVRVDANQG